MARLSPYLRVVIYCGLVKALINCLYEGWIEVYPLLLLIFYKFALSKTKIIPLNFT